MVVSPPEPAVTPSTRKFRQAAFVYLHVGLLYEFAVYAMWRADLVSELRGPPLIWLALGALIVAFVFWGLWFRQSRWLARGIWAVHSFRLPWLLDGAFLTPAGEGLLPPRFYVVAIIVVVANLWMLARAGWDL